MSDSRLCVTNLSLAATWSQTTGGTATGYALTNLNSTKRGLPWRSSTTTGNQVIVATLSAPTTLKAIALINWLAHTSGGTVKAETKDSTGANTYSNFGGGTGLFTLPSSNRTRVTALYSTGGVTADTVRITFTNTGSVSGYVEIGVAFVSTYTQTAQNVAPGITMTPVDPSVMKMTEGGQEFFWTKQSYSTPTVSYKALQDADRVLLMAAFDTAGARTPVLFAIDPSDLDKTYYGYLPSQLKTTHMANSLNLWQVDVAFREAC